jgi:hypothetical protein
MPKIRNKVLEISGYDGNNDPIYNLKSGVLTKNFKKILDDSDFDQGEIPTSRETTGKILDDFSHYFDDSKTINIVNKTVNHTFGIEESYKSEENKILHTPNTFDENSAFNVTKDTDFSMYNNVLYKDNFEIQNTPYKEDYIDVNDTAFSNIQSTEFDVEKYRLSDQVAIEIDLNFDVPAILQNNKTKYSNFTKTSAAFSFTSSNKTWQANNTPVAYFNFKNNRWDYILNPYQAHPPRDFVDPDNFDKQGFSEDISKSNIAFGPGEPFDRTARLASGNVGLPCFNSKFPVGEQWYAEDDTLLDMSKYITGDFVLEKVIFEAESVDSYCLDSNNNNLKVYYIQDPNNPALTQDTTSSTSFNSLLAQNAFNFFILKQETESFNPLSFWEGSGLEVDRKYLNKFYFTDFGSGSGSELANVSNISFSIVNDYIANNTLEKGFYNIVPENDSIYDYPYELSSTGVVHKSAKRELISNFTTYIYNNTARNYYNEHPITQHDDILNAGYLSKSIHVNNSTDINFENLKLNFSSNIRIPNRSNIHHYHLLLDVGVGGNAICYLFSSNFLGGNNLQGDNSGFVLRNKQKYKKINSFDLKDETVDEFDQKYFNSSYLLKPSDKLILGVNAYRNGNSKPYIFSLKNSIKVKLIGRHVLNNNKIVTKTQSKNSSKSIRKEIKESIKDVWDIVPTENVFDGFYDNIYNNEEIYTTHQNILDREIYGKLSSKQFGSFSNLTTLFDNKNSIIYDTVMPNPVEYYKTSGNINVSFDNIRLSYEADGNHNNENYQWINSYPFESSFSNIYNKRDTFVDLAALGIEKFNIKVDKYFIPIECYQYYKKDSMYGNYSPGTIFKNVRGYIETETLTNEGNLYYLSQGKSISTAVPTNTFADIFIGNDGPFIIRMQGDVFDVDKDFLGEGTMPDTLNANPGRIVFYNTNIETDSDQTFNFKNISNPNSSRQKFLPFKLIARLSSGRSFSDYNNILNDQSFDDTYDFSNPSTLGNVQDITPGATSDFAYANSLDNTNTGFGYYPYLENNTILSYQANDFESEDVLDRLNKVFFGYTNIKGKSYRYYPLVRHDGWKYGIYNSKQSGLSYNFNWNSYGQFKDKYYGSKNTAIYKNDNEIEWPIVKKFVNKYFYPVANSDNSLVTYNKDYYARSNYPYIEDSQNTLSQYYNS